MEYGLTADVKLRFREDDVARFGEVVNAGSVVYSGSLRGATNTLRCGLCVRKAVQTTQVYTHALGLTSVMVISTAGLPPTSTTVMVPVAARNPLPRLLFPAPAQISNLVKDP